MASCLGVLPLLVVVLVPAKMFRRRDAEIAEGKRRKEVRIVDLCPDL